MGEMRRQMAWEEKQRQKHDRFASTIVISASIIAAVRLARCDVSKPTTEVETALRDSVRLARMIVDMVVR